MPSLFIKDKPFLSSERMFHKDYDRNDSVAKKKCSGCEPQGPCHHGEQTNGKPPVMK
jgi:hypothetical protein